MTTLSIAESTLAEPRSKPHVRANAVALDLLRFATVAVQLGLLVKVIRIFELENGELGQIVKIAWFGFVINHFLPARFRLPFFGLLSAATVVMILPAWPAAVVLGCGLLLIALCHVPVAFKWRVVLVVSAMTAILTLRMAWLPAAAAFTLPPRVGPILGSMFMFRLIVYMYDLRYNAAPFSLWRAMGYFFMLPNVAIALFPVVDYKTLCRSHYNDEPSRIYQVGVVWIFRGVLQLLLYQVVYLFLAVDPADVGNAWDVLQYVVTTFVLYLRVSGTFHVIVGLLHMFGFNLPETHHLYYLSSSFTDFWRRINIYWKDFLTKIVFYPAYFRLKRFGEQRAMVIATLIAFVTTWLLHSYQWLWLRGTFPMTWQDAIFWLGLGTLVVINMSRERTQSPKRTLGAARSSLTSDVRLGLRTAGTFLALLVLWTIWNTPSTSLVTLAKAARHVTAASMAALAVILLIVAVAGALLGRRKRAQTDGARARNQEAPLSFWTNASGIVAASLALIAVGQEPQLLARSHGASDMIVSIKRDKINRIDALGRERGYYQNLGDVFRLDSRAVVHPPREWSDNAAKHLRKDFRLWEYAPSSDVVHKGLAFTTNSFGLHDREYAVPKPPSTFRIAFVGSSHEVGAGVPLLDNYENLTEDLLNRQLVGSAVGHYEIVDFSVDGNPPLQKLATIDQLVYPFQPDLVLYLAHGSEFVWLPRFLDEFVNRDTPIPYDYIVDLLRKAGVEKGMSADDVSRRLKPFQQDIMRWIFRRLRDEAAAHGSRAGIVLLEKVEDKVRPRSLDELAQLAHEEDLPVIDLDGAFAGVQDRQSLFLAPWDFHPNEQGHRMLADKFYRVLVDSGLLSRPIGATLEPAARIMRRHPDRSHDGRGPHH